MGYVYPPGVVELRTVGKNQELWYQNKQLGFFDGRSGWVLGENFKQKDLRGVKIWRMALQTYYGIRPELRPSTPQPRKPRPEPRKPKVRPETKRGPTLLEELKQKESQQDVRKNPDPYTVWVLYMHLEDVLEKFGLTLHAALYHDIIRILDKRVGQPRMGPGWDGYRVLQVYVLREPDPRTASIKRIVARYAAGRDQYIEVSSDLFRGSGANASTNQSKIREYAGIMKAERSWGPFPPIRGRIQTVDADDVESYEEAEEGGYEYELDWSRPLTKRDIGTKFVSIVDGHNRAYAAEIAKVPIRVKK